MGLCALSVRAGLRRDSATTVLVRCTQRQRQRGVLFSLPQLQIGRRRRWDGRPVLLVSATRWCSLRDAPWCLDSQSQRAILHNEPSVRAIQLQRRSLWRCTRMSNLAKMGTISGLFVATAFGCESGGPVPDAGALDASTDSDAAVELLDCTVDFSPRALAFSSTSGAQLRTLTATLAGSECGVVTRIVVGFGSVSPGAPPPGPGDFGLVGCGDPCERTTHGTPIEFEVRYEDTDGQRDFRVLSTFTIPRGLSVDPVHLSSE